MKAISLNRPWPWAVCHAPAPKRIENRSYRPRSVLGDQVALHAGRRWDDVTAAAFAGAWPASFPQAPSDHPLGIVGVARVVGWIDVPGNATEGEVSDDDLHSRWLNGPIGWVLRDVVALPTPVPTPGRLGLWSLPTDVAMQVREQIVCVQDADLGIRHCPDCDLPYWSASPHVCPGPGAQWGVRGEGR